MLQPLISEFEPAAEAMRRIDATLVQLGYPDFADLACGRANSGAVYRAYQPCLAVYRRNLAAASGRSGDVGLPRHCSGCLRYSARCR